MSAPAPTSFSFEPFFLAAVVLAALAYARAAGGARPSRARVVLFALGLALIAAALDSPLETLAAHYLLVIHLLQNVMIADWAPPLLILGLTPAMRASLARRGGRAFTALARPKVALAVWLAGWYGIHLAGFYDFALRNAWCLNLEHALLIGIGTLFWWPVLAAEPARVATPVKLAYLGAAFIGSAFLGLALTFSARPFYDYYTGAPRLWGLSPAQDQNYGGILMSGEQSLVFLVAIGYFLHRLLAEEEERERALDAASAAGPAERRFG
jgi:cytochrome c oxidase assembly factor CtaG